MLERFGGKLEFSYQRFILSKGEIKMSIKDLLEGKLQIIKES